MVLVLSTVFFHDERFQVAAIFASNSQGLYFEEWTQVKF